MNAESFDVAIVGGGPAGLNAALVLGRMRRRVVLFDTDAPANAVSDGTHGFLSRDGTPPAEIRRIGREQLRPYETVELRAVAATAARPLPGGRFDVEAADGAALESRRLLLAHGMRYGLPELPGVADLWGDRIFHCPYCHGWEVRDRAVAVHNGGERAEHQASLLRSLSDDVVIVEDDIDRLERTDDGLRIVFANGAALDRDALFVQPELSLASDLAVTLGAALTASGSIEVDDAGKTSVPGLYAAGDAGAAVQSVAVATGSGARAGYAINAELASDDVGP